MTKKEFRVLHSTDVSLSLAVVLGQEENIFGNEDLLSFCKEGSLKKLLAQEYESVVEFNTALSANKVRISTVCINESLPDFLWRVVDRKVQLELHGFAKEAAVLSIRVLREVA